MTTLPKTLAILTALLFVGCGSLDRSAPPARSSALLTPIDAAASATVTDRLRPDLVWYDSTRDRVVRLAADTIVNVQDRAIRRELGAEPTQVRAFDDGSILVVIDDTLRALPADGSAAVRITAPVVEQIDGTSIDDFWAGGWALSALPGTSEEYGACHFVACAITTCVAFPNVGGYDGVMAVTPDSSVYMTDRDLGLYRFDGTRVLEVAHVDSGVTSFRRSGTSLIAMTYMSGAFRVDGDHTSHLTYDGSSLLDLVGTADDFYFATYDAQYTNDDPSCRPGFFSSCTQHIVWSQTLVYRSQGGHASEVGHEDCVADAANACRYEVVALGIDGEHAVLLGSRLRRTP